MAIRHPTRRPDLSSRQSWITQPMPKHVTIGFNFGLGEDAADVSDETAPRRVCKRKDPCYSVRSACIGSMRAARLAGTYAAASPIPNSSRLAAPRVNAS